MGLYPGFFHDGGAVAHEAAGADVELGGDIGTVGILAHETDDTEPAGRVETHHFRPVRIEKATADEGCDFVGSCFIIISQTPLGSLKLKKLR